MAIRFPQRPDGVQKKKTGVQNREFNETKVIEVPVYYPGDYEITWMTIDDIFFLERILSLTGEIQADVSQITDPLSFLSDENEDEDISLFINSVGGSEQGAIRIYNSMEKTAADVSTVVLGSALSSASLILAAGATPKRKALPHATVAIHARARANRTYSRNATIGLTKVRQLQRVRKEIVELYAKNTNKSSECILKTQHLRLRMSATKAQAYGIVDSVVKSKKKKTQLEKESKF